jgi:hypothetical protein
MSRKHSEKVPPSPEMVVQFVGAAVATLIGSIAPTISETNVSRAASKR